MVLEDTQGSRGLVTMSKGKCNDEISKIKFEIKNLSESEAKLRLIRQTKENLLRQIMYREYIEGETVQ